jgi:hypothetical protein
VEPHRDGRESRLRVALSTLPEEAAAAAATAGDGASSAGYDDDGVPYEFNELLTNAAKSFSNTVMTLLSSAYGPLHTMLPKAQKPDYGSSLNITTSIDAGATCQDIDASAHKFMAEMPEHFVRLCITRVGWAAPALSGFGVM